MENAGEHINKLPLWVLSKVLSYLNFEDRQNASVVSTTWYEAAQYPKLLQSTCISLKSDEDCQELLSGIARRGIQNLIIDFEDMYHDDISPEIASCAELIDNVRFLLLRENLTDRNVVATIGHFKNLQTLAMNLFHCSISGDEAQGAGALTEALSLVPKLICLVPVMASQEQINAMFTCFAGAKNIDIVATFPSFYYLDSSMMPLDPERGFIWKVLQLQGMICHLQVLDLLWCRTSLRSLEKLVEIPFAKLHTLRVNGFSGGEPKLVADTGWSLRALHLVYQTNVRATLNYREVEYLMTRKPSINCLELSGIDFRHALSDDPFKAFIKVSKEWRDIGELDILGQEVLIVEETILKFRKLGRSRTLEVDTPSDIDDDAMTTLAEHSPGLRGLMIQSPSLLEGRSGYLGMSVIVDRFPHLNRLVLIECDLRYLDDKLSAAVSKLTQLETFCLGFSRGVTDVHLVGLCLPNVKRLMLPDGSELTDRAVDSIASCNPTLQSLDISGCTRISDEGIASAASHLKYLRFLFLIDCGEITQKSAVALSEKCLLLQMVDASECDESFVGALKDQRPSLPYLSSIKTDTFMESHKMTIMMRSDDYDTLSW